MVFLSRLTVSQACRKVRSEVAYPLDMHRTLARAFGDYIGGLEDARLLYRIDREPRLHALVQTKYRPNWQRLDIPSNYLAAPPEVKEIEPDFHDGDRFVFRLRANPTLRVDGKRCGLYSYEEQVNWLGRKSIEAGFRVETVSLRQDECLEVRSTDRVAKYATVQFDGVLRVTNSVLLMDTFENGLGSARVMGCGLLSLARC